MGRGKNKKKPMTDEQHENVLNAMIRRVHAKQSGSEKIEKVNFTLTESITSFSPFSSSDIVQQFPGALVDCTDTLTQNIYDLAQMLLDNTIVHVQYFHRTPTNHSKFVRLQESVMRDLKLTEEKEVAGWYIKCGGSFMYGSSEWSLQESVLQICQFVTQCTALHSKNEIMIKSGATWVE